MSARRLTDYEQRIQVYVHDLGSAVSDVTKKKRT